MLNMRTASVLASVGLYGLASGLVQRNIIRPSSSSERWITSAPLRSSAAAVASAEAAEASAANIFRDELEEAGLSSCLGALHASGCRRFSDLRLLTPDQVEDIGLGVADRAVIGHHAAHQSAVADMMGERDGYASSPGLSTFISGGTFSAGEGFGFECICAENQIFMGECIAFHTLPQL